MGFFRKSYDAEISNDVPYAAENYQKSYTGRVIAYSDDRMDLLYDSGGYLFVSEGDHYTTPPLPLSDCERIICNLQEEQ